MIRLLQFFWHGCAHTWQPTSQSTYDEPGYGNGPCVYVVCSKCGHRRMFKNATIGDWEEPHP